MMKPLLIIGCLIAASVLAYSVGYRSGHSDGAEAVKEVALDAINDVTAHAQKALNELAEECVAASSGYIAHD